MIRWLRTNQFLRRALEDAHSALSACSADLEIERFANERLEHHLTKVANERCPMCDELARDRDTLVDHAHKLEADNTRLEWENEKWRQRFYEKFSPPVPGIDS